MYLPGIKHLLEAIRSYRKSRTLRRQAQFTSDSFNPDVVITRGESTEQGTYGSLVGPNNFRCESLELPDYDNKTNISCISEGDYHCSVYISKRFGTVYQVQDVQGRSYILFHVGNWAGDVTRGWISNSYGCILLGRQRAVMKGQKAITLSRFTISDFMTLMGGKDFKLRIQRA
jgi:hypothetical protein